MHRDDKAMLQVSLNFDPIIFDSASGGVTLIWFPN